MHKWSVFVKNKLPDAWKLGTCIFFREEADFKGPGPWEGRSDPEKLVSDLKIRNSFFFNKGFMSPHLSLGDTSRLSMASTRSLGSALSFGSSRAESMIEVSSMNPIVIRSLSGHIRHESDHH